MDTNLTSVFLLCRAFVPHMKGQRLWPHHQYDVDHELDFAAGRAAYSSSKAALLG